MAGLVSCHCRKRWASGFEVEAALEIPPDRPVTVLFGPSGTGKTTLLRMLAGLERPDEGSISVAGRVWFDAGQGIDLPPGTRRSGFVFQDYALFPHLTIAQNVAYAATVLPISVGGHGVPSLLLLDEPLSALDAATRARTRRELRRMLLAGGVPAIVVTHDRMEAVALGDWMAVMVDGRVCQTGPVQEVFRKPADSRVAATLGVENVLPAEIVGCHGGLLELALGAGRIECVDSGETGAVFACIRAEDVALTRHHEQTSSARNRIEGRVTAVTPEGALARVELNCGFPLVALVTAQSAAELDLREGEPVAAVIKATAVHLAQG